MTLEGSHISRFRLLRLLGRGGMGEVYLAEDEQLRRPVAIKIIGAKAFDENASRLFLREARAIASLNHPHILPLFDFGEATLAGTPLTYMVMPFCEEDTLATWMVQRRKTGAISTHVVEGIVEQAAAALDYAHSQHIVHQDVKPSNFLIRSGQGPAGTPDLLLADFGVARFTGATATVSQTVRGTPASMAPEQWEGTPVPATDQYALAILAYELLTGHPPFQGSLGQVMYQHLHVAPSPASASNPYLSAEVDTVLLHALAKKPEARFASISAFARALQQALQASAFSPTQKREEKSTPSIILLISEAEALTGTERQLTLPDGRHVSVSVPAGAQDGQVIHLDGRADAAGDEGVALILTVRVAPAEEQAHFATEEATVLNSGAGGSASEEATGRGRAVRGLEGDQGHDQSVPTQATVLSSAAATAATVLNSDPFASDKTTQAEAHVTPVIPSAARPTRPAGGRALVLAALAFMVIAGGVAGFLLFVRGNQQSPSSLYGTLALNDPLNDNSRGYGWSELNESARSCAFTQGAYHVTDLQNTTTPFCTATHTTFGDFAYQVQVTIVKGDAGGIIFREDTDFKKGNFYLFGIDATGRYALDVLQNYLIATTLRSGSNSAINTGLSQSNVLTVVASGANIDLYANGQKIDSVSDSTFSQGYVGVFASDFNNPTEVVFSNAKVWTQ